MAKKRVSKSRKKSYLKRASKRKDRRISRRKDKRKIKKTRKKNKRGGSSLSQGASHLLKQPIFAEDRINATGIVETIDEGFGDQKEILFNETHSPDRTFNVLETLYGGDPEVVGRKIELYNKEKHGIVRKIWSRDTKHSADRDEEKKKRVAEYDKENFQILNQIFPSGYPTYILISGHGSMIDCIEITRNHCFTLLPHGYKLILASGTGEFLSAERSSESGLEWKQDYSSYYRMYEGLIPNQIIDFNLVQRDMNTGELNEDTVFNPGSVQKDLPGVYITGVKAPIEIGSRLDYYINFLSNAENTTEIQMTDAIKVDAGEATLSEITQYADAMVSGLLPLPETPIKGYSETYSIMPIDKIKEQIINIKTQHIPFQPRDRLIDFKLSELLKHIEEAGKTNENVPKVILGGFCRGGDFNSDIKDLGENCERFKPTLPPLTADYFSGSVSYKGLHGVSDELRRNKSLASKTKPQNFWSIYYNLKQKLEYFTTIEGEIDPSIPRPLPSEVAEYDSNRSQIVTEFQRIINKIEVDSSQMVNGIYKGINLTKNEVCLIFQMDNCLKLHPHGMPYPPKAVAAPDPEAGTEVDEEREGGVEVERGGEGR
jgi:hypothetical protein